MNLDAPVRCLPCPRGVLGREATGPAIKNPNAFQSNALGHEELLDGHCTSHSKFRRRRRQSKGISAAVKIDALAAIALLPSACRSPSSISTALL